MNWDSAFLPRFAYKPKARIAERFSSLAQIANTSEIKIAHYNYINIHHLFE